MYDGSKVVFFVGVVLLVGLMMLVVERDVEVWLNYVDEDSEEFFGKLEIVCLSV